MDGNGTDSPETAPGDATATAGDLSADAAALEKALADKAVAEEALKAVQDMVAALEAALKEAQEQLAKATGEDKTKLEEDIATLQALIGQANLDKAVKEQALAEEAVKLLTLKTQLIASEAALAVSETDKQHALDQLAAKVAELAAAQANLIEMTANHAQIKAMADLLTTQLAALKNDTDGDGVKNTEDNCPTIPNASQTIVADFDGYVGVDMAPAIPTERPGIVCAVDVVWVAHQQGQQVVGSANGSFAHPYLYDGTSMSLEIPVTVARMQHMRVLALMQGTYTIDHKLELQEDSTANTKASALSIIGGFDATGSYHEYADRKIACDPMQATCLVVELPGGGPGVVIGGPGDAQGNSRPSIVNLHLEVKQGAGVVASAHQGIRFVQDGRLFMSVLRVDGAYNSPEVSGVQILSQGAQADVSIFESHIYVGGASLQVPVAPPANAKGIEGQSNMQDVAGKKLSDTFILRVEESQIAVRAQTWGGAPPSEARGVLATAGLAAPIAGTSSSLHLLRNTIDLTDGAAELRYGIDLNAIPMVIVANQQVLVTKGNDLRGIVVESADMAILVNNGIVVASKPVVNFVPPTAQLALGISVIDTNNAAVWHNTIRASYAHSVIGIWMENNGGAGGFGNSIVNNFIEASDADVNVNGYLVPLASAAPPAAAGQFRIANNLFMPANSLMLEEMNGWPGLLPLAGLNVAGPWNEGDGVLPGIYDVLGNLNSGNAHFGVQLFWQQSLKLNKNLFQIMFGSAAKDSALPVLPITNFITQLTNLHLQDYVADLLSTDLCMMGRPEVQPDIGACEVQQ